MKNVSVPTNIEQLSVDTLRTLAMDAVEKATCGHPGMPMGMADAAYVLWTRFLRHNPNDPKWFDRDRFVLSAGHGSMLLYSLLYLTGYPEMTMDELKNFRQWGSITPGHPEYGLTPGVETTTGPLGQGFATGVGMAMAEAHLAARFNTDEHDIVDHYVYAIVSDGDLMEGISHEAASLAGHLKLGKLVYLYDANNISIDGSTELAYTEDVAQRFEAYKWHVQDIDGHNRQEVETAIEQARKVDDQPSIIICRTHIGFGSPNKQDTAAAHGAALGEDEVRKTKEYYGWDPDKKFYVPDEVLEHYRQAKDRGKKLQEEWNAKIEAYQKDKPEKADLFEQFRSRTLKETLEEALPKFDADAKGMATRKASGKVLNALVGAVPNLVGGSADLTGSNKTKLENEAVFNAENYAGRYFHFGVREHAMSAALNGMALHGGLIPFGGTFLIFSDYARPAIRIAALSHIPSNFVMTHDSIGLGEDGPTHQPIEHLSSLRAMPNLYVIRPADANETARAWKMMVERTDGPSLLVLTRQGLPVFEETTDGAEGVEKGAYTLADADDGKPEALLLASGSEVEIAMKARKLLKDEHGVQARVVSMPCWERFEEQPESYRNEVLPPDVTNRVSIEAGATLGWQKWTGDHGFAMGVDRFGASAPYQEIYKQYGLTPEKMAEKVLELRDKG